MKEVIMFTFLDLQNEVKRRALRNQSGTEYDEEIKNVINTTLFRIAREANWRVLRRKTYFTTKTSYTSGTGYALVTNSSTAFSFTSTACDLWTDKIEVGRRIDFGTDSYYYTIMALNSNTNGVLDVPFRGTTSTATTYKIYPQEEYNLPIQVDHRAFLWHEDFGYPFLMNYLPEQTFIGSGSEIVEEDTPTHYRMWGENTVMAQPPTATPLSIISTSSSTSDTTVQISIFGKSAGYPYSESVTVRGLTNTNSTVEFESIERVSKDATTNGRISITSSRGSYTIAVLPAGDTTATIKYSKVQLYPLPTRNFNINVCYYKDPYRLVNDDDIHELGQEFDEAIILFSVAKIKYQENQIEADKWVMLYVDEIRNLKKTNMDKIDWLPTLQRPNKSRNQFVTANLLYRQVGGNYGRSG